MILQGTRPRTHVRSFRSGQSGSTETSLDQMEELARDLTERISPSGLKGSAFDTSHWRSEHATLAAWHDAFNLPTIEARVRDPDPLPLVREFAAARRSADHRSI